MDAQYIPNWNPTKNVWNHIDKVWFLPHRNGIGYVEYCRIDNNGKFYFVGGWSPQQKEQAIKALKKSILLTAPEYKEDGRKYLKQIQDA